MALTSTRLGRKLYRDYPEYKNYKAMIDRCRPSSAQRRNYAEKGISVCESWAAPGGFVAFYADMGEKPTPKHTIDRIDGTKGYSPENCRWATMVEQGNNVSRNRRIEVNGKSLTYAQWARELGASRHTIRERLLNGWPPEKAVSIPANHGNKWLGYSN